MHIENIELIKIAISMINPIILLVLGLIINGTIEKTKNNLLKEREWQGIWADKFLNIALEYSTTVSSIVINLFIAGQASEQQLKGWEIELSEKEKDLHGKIRKLQYLNWEIQSYIQFAPQNGVLVKEKEQELFKSLEELLKAKKGSLEKIRELQFEFNKSIQLAHREILGNKS